MNTYYPSNPELVLVDNSCIPQSTWFKVLYVYQPKHPIQPSGLFLC